MFWSLLTSGIDEANPHEHLWFCMERNSSEIGAILGGIASGLKDYKSAFLQFCSIFHMEPSMDACPINASAAGTENSSYLSTKLLLRYYYKCY